MGRDKAKRKLKGVQNSSTEVEGILNTMKGLDDKLEGFLEVGKLREINCARKAKNYALELYFKPIEDQLSKEERRVINKAKRDLAKEYNWD